MENSVPETKKMMEGRLAESTRNILESSGGVVYEEKRKLLKSAPNLMAERKAFTGAKTEWTIPVFFTDLYELLLSFTFLLRTIVMSAALMILKVVARGDDGMDIFARSDGKGRERIAAMTEAEEVGEGVDGERWKMAAGEEGEEERRTLGDSGGELRARGGRRGVKDGVFESFQDYTPSTMMGMSSVGGGGGGRSGGGGGVGSQVAFGQPTLSSGRIEYRRRGGLGGGGGGDQWTRSSSAIGMATGSSVGRGGENEVGNAPRKGVGARRSFLGSSGGLGDAEETVVGSGDEEEMDFFPVEFTEEEGETDTEEFSRQLRFVIDPVGSEDGGRGGMGKVRASLGVSKSGGGGGVRAEDDVVAALEFDDDDVVEVHGDDEGEDGDEDDARKGPLVEEKEEDEGEGEVGKEKGLGSGIRGSVVVLQEVPRDGGVQEVTRDGGAERLEGERSGDEQEEEDEEEELGVEGPIPRAVGDRGADMPKEEAELQHAFDTLKKELEFERSAAATAAEEAMMMIMRLQKEKAALQMASKQSARVADERQAYDEAELDIMKELLLKREEEKRILEKRIKTYKREVEVFRTERLRRRSRGGGGGGRYGSESESDHSRRHSLSYSSGGGGGGGVGGGAVGGRYGRESEKKPLFAGDHGFHSAPSEAAASIGGENEEHGDDEVEAPSTKVKKSFAGVGRMGGGRGGGLHDLASVNGTSADEEGRDEDDEDEKMDGEGSVVSAGGVSVLSWRGMVGDLRSIDGGKYSAAEEMELMGGFAGARGGARGRYDSHHDDEDERWMLMSLGGSVKSLPSLVKPASALSLSQAVGGGDIATLSLSQQQHALLAEQEEEVLSASPRSSMRSFRVVEAASAASAASAAPAAPAAAVDDDTGSVSKLLASPRAAAPPTAESIKSSGEERRMFVGPSEGEDEENAAKAARMIDDRGMEIDDAASCRSGARSVRSDLDRAGGKGKQKQDRQDSRVETRAESDGEKSMMSEARSMRSEVRSVKSLRSTRSIKAIIPGQANGKLVESFHSEDVSAEESDDRMALPPMAVGGGSRGAGGGGGGGGGRSWFDHEEDSDVVVGAAGIDFSSPSISRKARGGSWGRGVMSNRASGGEEDMMEAAAGLGGVVGKGKGGGGDSSSAAGSRRDHEVLGLRSERIESSADEEENLRQSRGGPEPATIPSVRRGRSEAEDDGFGGAAGGRRVASSRRGLPVVEESKQRYPDEDDYYDEEEGEEEEEEEEELMEGEEVYTDEYEDGDMEEEEGDEEEEEEEEVGSTELSTSSGTASPLKQKHMKVEEEIDDLYCRLEMLAREKQLMASLQKNEPASPLFGVKGAGALNGDVRDKKQLLPTAAKEIPTLRPEFSPGLFSKKQDVITTDWESMKNNAGGKSTKQNHVTTTTKVF
ncbi:hypothetical protein CBR_g12419 [Chara braunii]|uniref:GTD-binding domain-containing protein n=1 Tax=Chara braunii TaxID=69332 RepID=A0A388JSD8_CHABU|nr:hypothetical protein CBR_g12419 [Chara braunii]|eukprot:GBG60683.1 hypothetical protein CBR_g12419 [Chara braunii]